MAGTRADKGQKPRGIHMAWIILPVLVAVSLAVRTPTWVTAFFQKNTIGAAASAVKTKAPVAATFTAQVPAKDTGALENVPAHAVISYGPEGGRRIPHAVTEKAGSAGSTVYMTGMVEFPRGVRRAFFSDGSSALMGDKGVLFVGKTGAVVDGKAYVFRSKEPEMARSSAMAGTFTGF